MSTQFATRFRTTGSAPWLAQKLTSHGIGGKVYDWLAEWLSGRFQRVCLHGVLVVLGYNRSL